MYSEMRYIINRMILITKVVTKNFIMDWVATIQNMIGMNIKTYEKMIEKAKEQIEQELKEKKIKLKWYRYEIAQLTNGAMSVTIYGNIQR